MLIVTRVRTLRSSERFRPWASPLHDEEGLLPAGDWGQDMDQE